MSGPNFDPSLIGQILAVAGVFSLGSRTITAGPVTVGDSDFTLVVNQTVAGPISIPLPDAAGLSAVDGSRRLRVFDGKGDAATNPITLTGTSALIDGSASVVINTNWGYLDLEWRGTYWHVLNAGGFAAAPAAHATTHELGGSDQLALDGSQITAGNIALARIATALATGGDPIKGTNLTGTQDLSLTAGGTHTAAAGVTGLAATGSVGAATGLKIAAGDGKSISIRPQGSAATADIGCEPMSFSLANNATYDYDPESHGGVMIVGDDSAGLGAIINFANNGATTSIALSAGVTLTLATPASLNIAATGGKVRFENKTGGTLKIVAVPFRVVAT